MKVLVVGSGGREHALCTAFARSPRVSKLYCAGGNAGIAQVAECFAVRPDDVQAVSDLAAANAIDLTFIGPENPLANGIVDEFQARGLQIIGASQEAAQLEASKSFAKDFMARHGVPTARYITAHSPSFAALALESGDFGNEASPVVVKADGLAAGKGVVVARDRMEALSAINGLEAIAGADATKKIILEECLEGREVSLILFADGEDFALMPPTRDHKRIGDGDTGPNTGGMGAITDASILPEDELARIVEAIVRPTLHGCIREGFRFRGILFLGLMLTKNGPMVLEYNVRFGDPETEAILVRLETDLVDICEAMLTGRLRETRVEWQPGSSATVVLAAEGYPQRPRTGDVITGVADAAAMPRTSVFHCGTAMDQNGQLVTAGGRVLAVTSVGGDLSEAIGRAYSAAEQISWNGMQYRKDIGKPPATA